jgi:hypothetical protein
MGVATTPSSETTDPLSVVIRKASATRRPRVGPGHPGWLLAGNANILRSVCLRGFGFDDEVSGSGASEFPRIGYGGKLRSRLLVSMRSRTTRSLRTVIFALAASLGAALAKLLAALFTRSSAMLAEAFHAFADSGNEVLLLVAERRTSRSPDAQHPLGHGRAAYFWALIASLGVFAVVSVRPSALPRGA